MSEEDKKEWVRKNRILQDLYEEYNCASNNQQRENLLKNIQIILNQNPFLTYCSSNGAAVSGITRYGLDYLTERCIIEIDNRANEISDDFDCF